MRKIIVGLLFALWTTACVAQAPPPVPALPDTARLTTYSITATTCNCAVGFQLYGDSTDVTNWIQVWVNGVQMAQPGNWAITSPTGSLATIARPITDAVLNFTAVQTGTIQIVGARRPRRLSQFGTSVAARDLNVAVTDLVAENREQWDALLRTMMVPPGDTAPSMILPSVAARASKFLGFDAAGTPAVFTPGAGSGGNIVGSGSSTNGNLVCYNGTSGLAVIDCGVGTPIPIAKGGTSQITAPLARSAAGLNIDQLTSVGNANYTILSTDRTVGTNATLTLPRTWTLPAANAVNPGQSLTVADFFGGVSGTNTLTIQRAGADTISGGTSIFINVAFGRYEFRSDGVSKWSAVATTSNTLPYRSPTDYGAVCNGTTDDLTAVQAWLNALSGAYIGYIPPGVTCGISFPVIVKNDTTIIAPGGTIKCINAANAACGVLLTDAAFGTAPGPSRVRISGLTLDGNQAGRAAGPFSFASLYMTGATDVWITDVKCIGGAADCFYVGGNTTTTGVSARIFFTNVVCVVAKRNCMSVVGVSGFKLNGCNFSGAITAPGLGLDIEPDSANTPDVDVSVAQCVFTGNGGGGMSVNPAAIAGSVLRGFAFMNSSNSNGGYGYSQYGGTTIAQFKYAGAFGTGNATALFGGTVPASDSLP